MNTVGMENKKILLTGLTGQVAKPVALSFAKNNDVWGIARFSNPDIRKELMDAGIHCVKFDLSAPDFSEIPDDFDYVLNFAVSFDPNFDVAITAVVEGLGFLMSHCRKAKAFLHCSTCGVYEVRGRKPMKETDPLGDSHSALLPSYSICKIAAEGMARFCAKKWNLPTVIARLNVPYGDNGGWPGLHLELILADQPVAVHTNKPSVYNPIHEDDIIETIPKLIEAATVPANIVNWAGTEKVSLEDWSNHIAKLVGKTVGFEYTVDTLGSSVADTEKMEAITGKTKVDWKDGIRRMIKARHPEIELRR